MSLVRQDTDCAMRVMVILSRHYGKRPLSARRLAREAEVSYHFACKILQRLDDADLVESMMGPTGGYRLKRGPQAISMREVIEAVQGSLNVNKCLLGLNVCTRTSTCPVREKLVELQDYVGGFLSDVSLAELVENKHPEEMN